MAKEFTWCLVSSGRLDVGEKFSISIKDKNGELFSNPIDPERIMNKIEWLFADEHTRFATRQYSELDEDGKIKINNLMDALLAIKQPTPESERV